MYEYTGGAKARFRTVDFNGDKIVASKPQSILSGLWKSRNAKHNANTNSSRLRIS